MLKELGSLTQHHLKHCAAYARLFEKLKLKLPPYAALEEIPYLPAGLFKSHELLSIPKEHVFKTLLSSGTTSTIPSRIFLDRETAQQQTAALAAIVTSFIGKERRPLLVVDTEEVIRDRTLFSARGAALVGMLLFGRDSFYLFDHDAAAFETWQRQHKDEPWLIFGFTSLIWQASLPLCPPGSILLHGGGWKKLETQGVSNEDFKAKLKSRSGIAHCHNFYGMVEQTGSIAMECEEGQLHTSDYSDILIRNQDTFKEAKRGEVGVIQTFSTLPKSYPGHSLLTEDLGFECGEDQCPCGRKGKTFQVVGRVPEAELRGCSDVGGV